jgi:hypothetical protein
MAWANPKIIPASCVHLDFRAIEAELIKTCGNVSEAAKTLRVPSADLRRLVWSTPLADTVYEQLEETLDEAQQVIRTALRSDNKEHKLAAAKVMLTQTTEGRRRGWGAALLDEREAETRPATTIKWLEH